MVRQIAVAIIKLCVLCPVLLFAAILVGLCFGVDPLDRGITKGGVQACMATQRIGDKRLYAYIDNASNEPVVLNLKVSVIDHKTNQRQTRTLRTDLSAHQEKRLYPSDPTEEYSAIFSMTVRKSQLR